MLAPNRCDRGPATATRVIRLKPPTSSAGCAVEPIVQNATLTSSFREDAALAQRLGTVVDGLRPAHVQEIKRLGTGECVLVWEGDGDAQRQNEVFVGHVEPTDAELRVFTGT